MCYLMQHNLRGWRSAMLQLIFFLEEVKIVHIWCALLNLSGTHRNSVYRKHWQPFHTNWTSLWSISFLQFTDEIGHWFLLHMSLHLATESSNHCLQGLTQSALQLKLKAEGRIFKDDGGQRSRNRVENWSEKNEEVVVTHRYSSDFRL